MVHLVEGARRSDGHWRENSSGYHPVVAGLLLVALTLSAVILAHFSLSAESTTFDALAALFAGALVLGLFFRLRGFRARRGSTEGASGDDPVVVRRSTVATHADARRHRRFVPARRSTTLHTHDGRQIAARIVDISIAGVAVEARLSDLEFVAINRVGARPAGPIRRTPVGAVFGFDTLLDPQPFDASFVL